MDKIYKIVLLGPTGVGKSQLCNFIMKDKENKTFKVSESINSCTQDPQLEYYTRNIEEYEKKKIKLELIDTAGSSDSGDNDERNFKSLIEKLREKKNVDFFFLVLNCTTRLEGPHKRYIEMISETFTPNEFYGHLEIIYTHYPNTIKEQKKYDIKKVEIIDAIKNIIGKATLNLDPPEAWTLDTDTDENDNFIEKYQKTIDVILLRMIAKVFRYGMVNTENLQYKGVKDRIKEENEKIEKAKKERQIEIQKIIEESERKRELKLREQQEYLRRIEYENERKKQELEEKQRRLYTLRHERRDFCFVF